ncbi:PREDICTED: uncharacterized protein LOC109114047 [Nelumbo nucifera]|uniref:Uncharacterized protein LOC109114047 n=2 Tax=Nelumbo nucifera TaxID=4432 RepID=A0A1U8Q0S2_NELNU|nr:PREDICTED: uncharacterized protein LOC109114047 [Nelumbo nucifera]DAD22636.1 TPA_asm: hypothetical protein HUJ06_024099 [Nelumbo nucifera]
METSSCFIYNSDKFFYDSLIPPLHSAQQLQYGQLPLTRMHYRLTASDMAALAVKPSTAHSYGFQLRDLWLLKWQHYRMTASDMAALAVKASTAHSYDFRLRDLCQANCSTSFQRSLAVEMGLSSQRSLPSELFNRDIC